MTCTTVRGTITLAAAIRCRAALLPSLSTAYAARWQSARAASSSTRLSAIRSRTADCSASVLPNAVRDFERSTISWSARSPAPRARITWWMRPGPSRAWALAKPPPSSPSRLVSGTRTSVNSIRQWPWWS